MMRDTRRFAVLICGIALVALPGAPLPAENAEEAKSFVEFVTDNDARCVTLEGQMILVRSKHLTKPIRVWLERYHMGADTGDRSRSDLLPQAEAEKLGCSRTVNGSQEWRIIKAQFIDAK